MSKQLIITVGREYGSGGHMIANALAGRFGLPVYERNLLEQIARSLHADTSELEKYEEAPKKLVVSRTVHGFSNAPEDNLARLEFGYLKKLADQGNSFVVVGRCAEEMLLGYDLMIPLFVQADLDFRIRRIMERRGVSESEAASLSSRTDKARKAYHNQFCKGKWGDPRLYDVVINSARLGIEGTVDILESYVRARMAK